jgi:hypothetical protein
VSAASRHQQAVELCPDIGFSWFSKPATDAPKPHVAWNETNDSSIEHSESFVALMEGIGYFYLDWL